MMTVVSGLPRSGTSLMMQMLAAGGLPVLVDERRPADADNPRGYYEYEPVTRLEKDDSWLATADGKALKVVSPLLEFLPAPFEYRVIWMQRSLDEVLRSQQKMLQRRNEPSGPEQTAMHRHFERHVEKTRRWLSAQSRFRVLECEFAALIAQPQDEISRIAEFLERDLDRPAMAAVIQPELYRQRER